MQGFVPGTAEHDREPQPTETGVSRSSKHPEVFISYAWESDELKKWVLERIEMLRIPRAMPEMYVNQARRRGGAASKSGCRACGH